MRKSRQSNAREEEEERMATDDASRKDLTLQNLTV
jgi:hypothetical protein